MVEAEGRQYSFDTVEALRPEVLETFPYEYAGRAAVVEITTDEFTCVCPFSGLPGAQVRTLCSVRRAQVAQVLPAQLPDRRNLPGARCQPGSRRSRGEL